MGSVDGVPPQLAEVAARIVEAVADIPPARVINIPRGVMTWKFEVALDSGERFIVRFYPPGREAVLEYEPDLLRRSAAAGVPVPSVVADARSGPSCPHPYVLYRRLDGETLGDCWSRLDAAARRRAAAELRAALERLETVAIEGWGEMVSAWHAREASWQGFVARAIDEGLAAARDSRTLSADLLGTVASIRAALGAFTPPERPTLVWADVSPENVLVGRDGALAGLLDFESCIGGELCTNLGYCAAAQWGTGFYEALREAWAADPAAPEAARLELYAVVRGMLIAKFADRALLPAGVPRQPVEVFLPGLRPAAENLLRRLQRA